MIFICIFNSCVISPVGGDLWGTYHVRFGPGLPKPAWFPTPGHLYLRLLRGGAGQDGVWKVRRPILTHLSLATDRQRVGKYRL